MNDPILQVLVPAIGLVSGLIATYVSLQNRALLAEVRKEIAELENRIIARINGTYVRAGECHLRQELVAERISALAAAAHKAEPPPDR
jgi:hypothetical protein